MSDFSQMSNQEILSLIEPLRTSKYDPANDNYDYDEPETSDRITVPVAAGIFAIVVAVFALGFLSCAVLARMVPQKF